MGFQGRENAYLCDVCGGYTSTIDVDDGVTPMLIACRASGNEGECSGTAHSLMYPSGPRPDRVPAPAWEWYAPDTIELMNVDQETFQHCRKGGLLLRKIAT